MLRYGRAKNKSAILLCFILSSILLITGGCIQTRPADRSAATRELRQYTALIDEYYDSVALDVQSANYPVAESDGTQLVFEASLNCLTTQPLVLKLYYVYAGGVPVRAYVVSNLSDTEITMNIHDYPGNVSEITLDTIDYRTIRFLGPHLYDFFDIVDFIDQDITGILHTPRFPDLNSVKSMFAVWRSEGKIVPIGQADAETILGLLGDHSERWTLDRAVPSCPVGNICIYIETAQGFSCISLTGDGCKTAKIDDAYYSLENIRAIQALLIEYGIADEMWQDAIEFEQSE